jgi:hypothetical protein
MKTKLLTRAVVIFILALLFFSGLGIGQANATIGPMIIRITVWGYIKDGTTSDPLTGASVSISGIGSTTTGANGYYSFVVNDYGTWTVVANKNGFDQTQNSGTISEGTSLHVDVNMVHSYGIYGRVRSADSGNPLIGGATINRWMWENEISTWGTFGTTDANGFYYYAPVTTWGSGSYNDDGIAEKPGWFQGTTPVAGYWGHHTSYSTSRYSKTQVNYYLRRATLVDTVVSGVLVNYTAVNNTAINAENAQYWISRTSTTSFGFSGSVILGFGYSSIYSYTQNGQGGGPFTLNKNTGNALYTWMKVEATGITEGTYGTNYHEVNRHVGQVMEVHSISGWYKDPVKSNDARYGLTIYYTNNGGFPISASENSLSVLYADFSISYTSYNVPTKLSITGSFSSTETSTIGATIRTNSQSPQVGFRYFFETTSPGKGIFLHIYYLTYA